MLVRAEQVKYRLHEGGHDEREKRCREYRGVDAEGAHPSRLVLPLLSEQARYERAAADARQVRERERYVEYRKDERERRHHVRVVRLADVEGVREVVNEDDKLADYRRECHYFQSLQDRQRFKNGRSFGAALHKIKTFSCFIAAARASNRSRNIVARAAVHSNG